MDEESIFARNLINRPYGTGCAFLLFPGTSCQVIFALIPPG